MLKVLHISTLSHGGAANAAIRLHLGLLKIGIQSKFLSLAKFKGAVQHSFVYSPSCFDYIRRITLSASIRVNGIRDTLIKRPKGFEIFTTIESPYRLTNMPLYKEADVINLHWVAGFIDYQTFFRNNKKPLVWTLHDANPFTGGCHYFGSCSGYLNICSECPQLEGTSRQDYAETAFKKKIEIYSNLENIVIVAPSRWLYAISSNSIAFRSFPHRYIPYGIDHNVFKPIPRFKARSKYSLPSDKIVILFVAHSTENKRKGYQYLLEAIKCLNLEDNVILCSVGHKNDKKHEKNHIEFGYIQDESLLAELYSAADLFVIPSTEDNFPNTVIESLMCGTPVLGFAVGGITDAITDGFNGFLAQEVNAHSLAKIIEKGIQHLEKFDRDAISKDANHKYRLEVQANSYKDLYCETVKKQD